MTEHRAREMAERRALLAARGTTVEAEGIFIRPAWARDAG